MSDTALLDNDPVPDEISDVGPTADDPGGPAHYVIISGYHDYRSKRRANLHFIADELVKRGSMFFFSLRYSYLTRRREDPRHDLWDRANRVERVGGVDAYLWRTPIHPFRMPARLRLAERALFGLFARHLPAAARAPITAATHIFIESGIAIVYLPLLKRLNPTAQIIYMASDSLGAIDQAETIKRAFHRHAHLVDSARLPSPLLRDDVPASIPCYFIPHGIEKEKFATIGPSPYPPGTVNAVSVGSMLFDNTFFEIAGPLFPDITFHVIGSGHKGESTTNVIYYPEMPFESTLPYLKHARFAIAAYGGGVAPYLTHTSMKLMQYGYLGLPAVCPTTVAGDRSAQFGYKAGAIDSISASVRLAIKAGATSQKSALSWKEVTLRWLFPEAYADTACAIPPLPDGETLSPVLRATALSSPVRASAGPLVSVVIPARNRTDLLARAIASVDAQTVSDVEIIVVDDASEPELATLPVTECKLRIVRNATRVGAQRSRLNGVTAARGEFVALLDSDDWWAPEKLERQLASLRTGQVDLASCRVVAARGSFRKEAPWRPLGNGERVEDFLYVEHGMLQTSTVVARREILAELLAASADSGVHNDTMLFLEAQRRQLRIAQMSDALSFFDDNPRTDRVSYDSSRIAASEAWYFAVSPEWSPAAQRGFMLTDMVTRYVNAGQRWKALIILINAFHPGIGFFFYLKKLSFVICNGPPLRFFQYGR